MKIHKDRRLPLGQIIFRSRFLFLLIYLLALIAVVPLGESFPSLKFFLQIAVSAIMISAIYAVSDKITYTVVGIFLAVPLLISIWGRELLGIRWLQLPESIIAIVFFGFIIALLLKFIFEQKEIKGDLIAGAAAVYLLLAIAWAYAYAAIGVIRPGSFAIADSQNITQSLALYYSFVTITTLGYGDIIPVSATARSCAILEAVVGQLYLVITIAWLVGVHVSQMLANREKQNKEENQE